MSGNATALEREAAATRHEKAGREKAERELQQLKETVSGTQTALERRHPLEARLIRELVSIEIKDPDYQDAILSGQTLTWKKYPFMDPATGKRIPEEYADNISVRIEGHGEDSFISMCGKRISDFFRDIWAKVKAALGIKQRQEEEKRKQQTQKPETGQTQEPPKKSRGRRM